MNWTYEIIHSCLRNVVSMFNVIEKEMQWRKENGRPQGFETLMKCKPIVCVGAEGPLGGQQLMADYYRASNVSKYTSRQFH